MKNFDEYAAVYDLINFDKNYRSEANYVSNHIRKRLPDAETLLDLGCGTGIHAQHFEDNGFRVVGIDRSHQNLFIATRRFLDRTAGQPMFFAADIANFMVKRRFDAAVSLFHVFSYLNRTDELLQAFRMARKHLKKGGLFLFDGWYGPAVLSQKPQVTVKHVDTDDLDIIRINEPMLHPNRNLVDVRIKVMMTKKKTSFSRTFQETHSMRYFFLPEIEYYLNTNAFRLLRATEWMTDAVLSEHSWSAYFVAEAI